MGHIDVPILGPKLFAEIAMDKTNILLIEPNHGSGLNPYPWGLLAIGSWLKECGYNVTLLVASYMTAKEFEAKIEHQLPLAHVVGIGCFSMDAHSVRSLSARIKEQYPDLPIAVGGPHAILRPHETITHSNIDVVMYGPGEISMQYLVEETLSKSPDYNRIPGILHKQRGLPTQTDQAAAIPQYAINYGLLPQRKRKRMGSYAEVLAGRGCSFKCSFCYNAVCGQKWVGKEAEALVAEIQALVDEYNPEYIYFRDENFFHSKKRIHEFIRLYKKRGFTFRWDATCRANYFTKGYVNEELLKELESINCQRLKFGIESGSERVLKLLNKGLNLKQIKHVVRLLSKSNIIGNYSFLMGVPGEEASEYRKTMALIHFTLQTDSGAEIIGPQYYRIYPGGELYDTIIGNYDFKEPSSFDEWADEVKNDSFGLNKDLDYPWVVDKDLPRNADLVVLLRRKPIKELLSPLKLPAIPFALMARIRMFTGWYGAMWDMRAAAFLFKRYVKSFYQPRAIKEQ